MRHVAVCVVLLCICVLVLVGCESGNQQEAVHKSTFDIPWNKVEEIVPTLYACEPDVAINVESFVVTCEGRRDTRLWDEGSERFTARSYLDIEVEDSNGSTGIRTYYVDESGVVIDANRPQYYE